MSSISQKYDRVVAQCDICLADTYHDCICKKCSVCGDTGEMRCYENSSDCGMTFSYEQVERLADSLQGLSQEHVDLSEQYDEAVDDKSVLKSSIKCLLEDFSDTKDLLDIALRGVISPNGGVYITENQLNSLLGARDILKAYKNKDAKGGN